MPRVPQSATAQAGWKQIHRWLMWCGFVAVIPALFFAHRAEDLAQLDLGPGRGAALEALVWAVPPLALNPSPATPGRSCRGRALVPDLRRLRSGALRELGPRVAGSSGCWPPGPSPRHTPPCSVRPVAARCARSDIDLLLVRPGRPGRPERGDEAWDAQVDHLVSTVSAWTGNDLRPLVYTLAELDAARGEPVLLDILESGITGAGERSWFQRQVRPRRAR